jgi:subtilisin family serine protease
MKTQSSAIRLVRQTARWLALLLALPVMLVAAMLLPQAPSFRLISDPGPGGQLTTASVSAPARSDRILVKPLPGVDLTALNMQLGVTVLRTFPGIGNLQVLQIPAGSLVADLISAYQASNLVQYAEPDYIVHLLVDPNDFRYWDGSLWAMKNTGQLGGTPGADIKAPEGWDIQHDASSIIVAVVDTGIRLTHEDLAGNLWTNPSPSSINDVHGINAITGTGDPTDDNGHGSHVSGTIGAVGNNSVGVVGVAWSVQLMALKFIDSQGNGAISDAVTCIDYARNHHANIINASWGGTGFQSTALHDSIAAARDAGILFVAAAGNSQGDNDTTPLYPASYNQELDNVIAVASTNRNDGLSSYSNYGARTVDLGAPGEDIFSCWNGSDSDYQYENGTSMAAAHVSGVAAVVLAHNPSAHYTTVAQSIFSGTDPLPSLQGKCVTGGRLNLYRALGVVSPPPTPPAAPSSLTATATSSSAINLTWTDNANNEDGYTVERSTDNATFTQIASIAANSTNYSDTGLTASTTYYYRVRAFNSAGNSAYSNTASATTQSPPPTPPAAPSNLSASATSSTAINLTWTDNANNENGFTVERSTDNATFTQIASIAANSTSYSDTGLTASTTYYYRVRAFNGAGNSAYSNTASATTQSPPPTPPAAPTNLSASATSSTAINLTWTDNANNENGFTVERSTDNATFTQIASIAANSTSYSDTGLAASTTYYYRVRAFNGAGNSAYSNTASATTQSPPPTPPAAPTNLSASATSSTAINLTWTDNANNENGFTVERSTDNATFTQIASIAANSTNYSDTGLTASTTYYYRVRAFNGAGNSAYSNTASATTQPPPVLATVIASMPLANEPGTPGQFTITRSGDTSQALTVCFKAGGTANPGTDYQSIGTSTVIPAGSSSVTVSVVPIDNHVVEVVPLTVTLTLTATPNYNVGLPGSAVVSILDSDLVALPGL